jgi:hypothetical protein
VRRKTDIGTGDLPDFDRPGLTKEAGSILLGRYGKTAFSSRFIMGSCA